MLGFRFVPVILYLHLYPRSNHDTFASLSNFAAIAAGANWRVRIAKDHRSKA